MEPREIHNESGQSLAPSSLKQNVKDIFFQPRVLVVDDEIRIQEACKRLLSEEGCEVEVAGNGTQGLAMIDEKHFDIEGAYNARYEIIKKRVDKAHIKGTRERITVPDKIAIIYSRQDDANTYRNYISYLETKGYLLKNSTEELELEDLQGITGLRALRVAVNYASTNGKLNAIEELIPSVEELG